jgi:hypothetical protein
MSSDDDDDDALISAFCTAEEASGIKQQEDSITPQQPQPEEGPRQVQQTAACKQQGGAASAESKLKEWAEKVQGLLQQRPTYSALVNHLRKGIRLSVSPDISAYEDLESKVSLCEDWKSRAQILQKSICSKGLEDRPAVHTLRDVVREGWSIKVQMRDLTVLQEYLDAGENWLVAAQEKLDMPADAVGIKLLRDQVWKIGIDLGDLEQKICCMAWNHQAGVVLGQQAGHSGKTYGTREIDKLVDDVGYLQQLHGTAVDSLIDSQLVAKLQTLSNNVAEWLGSFKTVQKASRLKIDDAAELIRMAEAKEIVPWVQNQFRSMEKRRDSAELWLARAGEHAEEESW